MTNPKSTAQIAGHPIHPMLIPFPIAFFVGTFACDLVYWQTSNPAWAIIPNGLLLSLIAVLLLLFSVWKGGELVFRGRIGVADN